MGANVPFVYSHSSLRARDQLNANLSLGSSYKEAAAIVIDGNSILRNGASSVSAISSIPAVAALTSGSAVLGGFLGVPVGLYFTRIGALQGRAAVLCKDVEGAGHSALLGTVGLSYAGISGVLSAYGIMGLQGAAAPASLIGSLGGLGIVMQTALTFYGAHGLYKTHEFGQELQKHIDDKGDALAWLADQLVVTDDEAKELSPEQIGELLKKKWNQFELRVGTDCAKMVRDNIFLKKRQPVDFENMIQAVVKANFKQQVRYALLLFIGLLGLAAFAAFMVVTGPLSPILFAVGSAFWLLIDSSKVHNYVAEKCWNWHSEGKPRVTHCNQPLSA